MINLSEITKTKNNDRAPSLMLYGLEGIGKTTFGADLPSPFFICEEDGMTNKAFDGVPRCFPRSWRETLEILDALAVQKHDFKTVIIDTMDALQKKLFSEIAQKNNKQNIEDIGYGKGYKFAALEIPQLMARFEMLQKKGVLICMLCHAGVKTFQNPEGENYDRYEPLLYKDISEQLKQFSDATLFVSYKVGVDSKKGIGGKERCVYTQHNAAYDAKNRFGLPEQIPLDARALLAMIDAGADDGLNQMVEKIEQLIPSLDEKTQSSIKKWLEEKKYTIASVSRTLKKCEEMAAIKTQEAKNA